MKGIFETLRGALAIASVVSLAACGGSEVTNVSLGGTVSGLTSGPLILTNGLSPVNIAAGSTTFIFPNRTTVGLGFNVFPIQQPPGLTCTVANGSGIAGTQDITGIAVTCAVNNSIGGSITGLTRAGLVLANGNDTVTVAANSSSFVFTNEQIAGSAYGVTILTQPANQTCTVAQGAGLVGQGDVTTVRVSCQ